MPITNADLVPGARFTAPDGVAITPAETVVEVVWVDRDRDVIHYRKEGLHELRQTTSCPSCVRRAKARDRMAIGVRTISNP